MDDWFSYDALRRLTLDDQASDIEDYMVVFGHTVGPASTRTIDYPYGPTVTETFDVGGRMSGVSGGTGVGAAWTFDVGDRRTGATLGNGIASTFDLDVNNRLTHLKHANQGISLFEVNLGYDEAGVRTYTEDVVQAGHSELYGHDARDRVRGFERGTLNAAKTAIETPLADPNLPSAQSWTTLDRRGNWLSSSKTVNGNTTTDTRTANSVNAYTLLGSAVPTYDANGNITQDPTARNHGDGLTPSGQKYAYDEENRLTAVRRATDNALLLEIKYDALGRRIQTEEYIDPTTGQLLLDARVTRHVYAGLKVISEFTLTDDGEGGTISTLAREFVWGRSFTEPVAMIDHTGEAAAAYHYLLGPLGSVVALTEASGTVVERYEYDAYGRTYIYDASGTLLVASAYGNPFGFTGQRYDATVGLYHFLFRSYSPILGRWLQRDPAGYVDGVSLYQYVGGNVLSLMDPFGLAGGSGGDGGRLDPSAFNTLNDGDVPDRTTSARRDGVSPPLASIDFDTDGLDRWIVTGLGAMAGGMLAGPAGAFIGGLGANVAHRITVNDDEPHMRTPNDIRFIPPPGMPQTDPRYPRELPRSTIHCHGHNQ